MKCILYFLALIGCAGMAVAQKIPADGLYFAQDPAFSDSGWKEQVVVGVKAGKIVSAAWNGISNLGGADKLSVVASGGYPMVKAGKAKAEWDVQAKAVQEYLIKSQNPDFKAFDATGHTDAISGASISVQGFYALVKAALASPPVAPGMYKKDGWYFKQEADFAKGSGWKDSVLITVVNGRVVDVLWNGTSSDKAKKSKLVESLAGRYGLEKSAKAGAWHLQAKAVQDAILAAQDPAKIKLAPSGAADAVTGATIKAGAVTLAVEALAGAR
jgi:major membrane immunogen (membrane-anchored lipoprotein)